MSLRSSGHFDIAPPRQHIISLPARRGRERRHCASAASNCALPLEYHYDFTRLHDDYVMLMKGADTSAPLVAHDD